MSVTRGFGLLKGDAAHRLQTLCSCGTRRCLAARSLGPPNNIYIYIYIYIYVYIYVHTIIIVIIIVKLIIIKLIIVIIIVIVIVIIIIIRRRIVKVIIRARNQLARAAARPPLLSMLSTGGQPVVNRWFCSSICLHRISFVRASEESFRTVSTIPQKAIGSVVFWANRPVGHTAG